MKVRCRFRYAAFSSLQHQGSAATVYALFVSVSTGKPARLPDMPFPSSPHWAPIKMVLDMVLGGFGFIFGQKKPAGNQVSPGANLCFRGKL